MTEFSHHRNRVNRPNRRAHRWHPRYRGTSILETRKADISLDGSSCSSTEVPAFRPVFPLAISYSGCYQKNPKNSKNTKTSSCHRFKKLVQLSRTANNKGGSIMEIRTHMTDAKARINLPMDFANSTILVEQISNTEIRIRKARVIPEDDLPFVEEAMAPLSDRDRDVFLALLDNPPAPNDALRRLLTSGHGPQEQEDADEGNRSGQPIDLVSLPWPDFFARVRREQHPGHPHMMQERLQVLREIGQLFAQKVPFRDLDYVGRQKIAGLFESANPDFLLFGSTWPVGKFKQAVKDNNEGVSLALDEIPLDGEVSRDHYQRFKDRFLKAYENKGKAVASPTRLLAMKRPDTFVCVNNQNKRLFPAIRLSPTKNLEEYWDLIERVRACVWWNAPPPPPGDEREVWTARAAFLDALFFTGKGIKSGSP
jgi:uncharacterized protein DUF1778